MQPHESGALFGHARCTAQESAERPTVIIRVPLVLEASCELYSDACGYSQRYNERVVCASINILDYGSSALVFERSLVAFAIYLCVGLRQALTDARTYPARG